MPADRTTLVVPSALRDSVASVHGLHTLAKYKFFVPGPFYVQFIFQPDAARAVFGVPVHELADRVIDLEHVWGRGANELIERVASRSEDPQAAAAAVEHLLAERIRTGAGTRV